MSKEIYKKMYYHLFNAITDALAVDSKEEIKESLMKAQQTTEEMYISYGEE